MSVHDPIRLSTGRRIGSATCIGKTIAGKRRRVHPTTRARGESREGTTGTGSASGVIVSNKWPRNAVNSIECRKRDLVLRITDWMRDKDEPAYDVECYIGGVYDWNESDTFTLSSGLTKAQAKAKAIAFAQSQVAKLL